MNKSILITGASSGLGKETAQKLAQEGYTVFAGVRKQTDKESVEKLHKNIIAVFLDVTDDKSIEDAYNFVTSHTTSLFAIINNAGTAQAGAIEYISTDVLKQQFDVNVFGAIRVAQKFLKYLDEKDCRIINISSMSSYGIFPFISPYCASKKALDMFFNSLLLECKKPNLKIISIKPGVIRTPIWDKSISACEKNIDLICDEGKQKYAQEFAFLAQNARKNNNKGLSPNVIAEKISKILKSKNPKLSYNIGKDSYFAKYLSYLPTGLVNKLVKFGLKTRMSQTQKNCRT